MPYRNISKFFIPVQYSEVEGEEDTCYVIKYGRWNGYIANNGHVESLLYLKKNLDDPRDIAFIDRVIEVSSKRFHKPIKV